MDWSDVCLVLVGAVSALMTQDLWRWLRDRPRRWATENPNPAPDGAAPVTKRPPFGRNGNPSVNEAQWVSDGKGGVRWLVPAEHRPKATPAPPVAPRDARRFPLLLGWPGWVAILRWDERGDGPAA
ncbi:MAG: hypothetical protein ACK5X3_00710 [Pseudomonadota bacterium]|jgi:hypothetical protein